jgi:hypothetical protein
LWSNLLLFLSPMTLLLSDTTWYPTWMILVYMQTCPILHECFPEVLGFIICFQYEQLVFIIDYCEHLNDLIGYEVTSYKCSVITICFHWPYFPIKKLLSGWKHHNFSPCGWKWHSLYVHSHISFMTYCNTMVCLNLKNIKGPHNYWILLSYKVI